MRHNPRYKTLLYTNHFHIAQKGIYFRLWHHLLLSHVFR
ncbi:unknown [Prevotella sp. CAG:1092]|nr:unknown [Prevotella sp. CAG:1092]